MPKSSLVAMVRPDEASIAAMTVSPAHELPGTIMVPERAASGGSKRCKREGHWSCDQQGRRRLRHRPGRVAARGRLTEGAGGGGIRGDDFWRRASSGELRPPGPNAPNCSETPGHSQTRHDGSAGLVALPEPEEVLYVTQTEDRKSVV